MQLVEVATVLSSQAPSTLLGTNGTDIIGSLVFVTGLAGHAFGSWKVRGGTTMWIRDFLAEDLDHDSLGKCRILTYGYDSRLVANDSRAGVCEFSRSFLEAIKNSRRLDNASVFI